jgi:hypothetical protein
MERLKILWLTGKKRVTFIMARTRKTAGRRWLSDAFFFSLWEKVWW